jgi:hypothetical protein
VTAADPDKGPCERARPGLAPEEERATLERVARSADKRRGWEDMHWALINSKELQSVQWST